MYNFRSMLSKGLKQPWPQLLEEFGIGNVKSDSLLKFFQPLVPMLDDMSPVPEIPDYGPVEETDTPILLSTPTPDNETTIDIASNSTIESENIETGTSLPIDDTDRAGTSQSTTFIAIAGVTLGVSIVVASVFLVNRRRKSKILRHGNQYEAVMRHSAGRPASFSPVVAKRLSENGEIPPGPPQFLTFKEIDLENNVPQNGEATTFDEIDLENNKPQNGT